MDLLRLCAFHIHLPAFLLDFNQFFLSTVNPRALPRAGDELRNGVQDDDDVNKPRSKPDGVDQNALEPLDAEEAELKVEHNEETTTKAPPPLQLINGHLPADLSKWTKHHKHHGKHDQKAEAFHGDMRRVGRNGTEGEVVHGEGDVTEKHKATREVLHIYRDGKKAVVKHEKEEVQNDDDV